MSELATTEEMKERVARIIEKKTPIVTRVFNPDCDHQDGGHNIIEYMVQDEEGQSFMHRLYQCNLCGVKVEGND